MISKEREQSEPIYVIIDKKVCEPTPELIAELFANLDADEQARFYNHLDEVASKWPGPFCFQLQAITDSPLLTYAGRRVMDEIGDYSHWGLVPEKNLHFLNDIETSLAEKEDS